MLIICDDSWYTQFKLQLITGGGDGIKSADRGLD